MDRRTENQLIGALSAVVVVGLIVLVAGTAIAQTNGRSDNVATLAVVSSPTTTSNLPPDKQAIVDRLAATRSAEGEYIADHPENQPAGDPPTLKPTIEPTSWSVGIVENGQAPTSSMSFGGINHWSWDIDGHHTGVYAGAEGYASADPGRGVLMVLASTMALHSIPELGGWYEAPPETGALRIVSYEGTVLTVEAATGETFYFDAETRDFTDANGDPVPTDTPTPAPPPAFTPASSLPFALPTPTPTASAQATVAATAAVGQ